MDKEALRAYSKQFYGASRSLVAEEILQEKDTETRHALLENFYTEQAQMIEEDYEWTDVKLLAEKHNIVTVNSIKSYGHMGPFRPNNRREFKFIRLFDVLLRDKLIVSGSSVVKGDTRTHVYGSWGIIIGEGTLENAFHYDATTWVSDEGIHSKFQPRLDRVRPAERVQYAIKGRKDHYNEVGTRVNGVAGIYFNTETNVESSDDLPRETFLDEVLPLGIPFYMLNQGEFYEVNDPTKISQGDYSSTPTPSGEIVQKIFRPTPMQRQKLVSFLSENLQLPPRNAVSNAVARADFVWNEKISPTEDARRVTRYVQEFIREQKMHMKENDKLSSHFYSALALYRFGDYLAQFNDLANAQKAYEIAQSVLSPAEYIEQISRVKPSGYLHVTDDDIDAYLRTNDLPDYLKY